MDEREDLGGRRMDATEARSFLADHGTGVLSLADDGAAYGLPISYGYDDERASAYFAFLRGGERSTKERFAAATDRATLTVYEVESPGEWYSVVAAGSVGRLPDRHRDRAVEAIDAGAWYPDLFRESAPTRGIELYELDVEELSGRAGRG